MDLRTKRDAQLEIRTMAHLFFEEFKEWMPEVAEFYESERFEKAKLSP
jgi:thymidylate synthase ThyX